MKGSAKQLIACFPDWETSHTFWAHRVICVVSAQKKLSLSLGSSPPSSREQGWADWEPVIVFGAWYPESTIVPEEGRMLSTRRR